MLWFADVVVLTSQGDGACVVDAVGRLRRIGLVTGVAVLTEGRAEGIEERVLEAGADLVVNLGHHPRFIASKLEALARRVRVKWTERDSGPEPALRIDIAARSIRTRGRNAEFSHTDFRLLLYLLDHGESWVSEAIIRHVFDTFHAPGASIARVHICSLRKALEPLGLRIQNRRSVGYRLVSGVARRCGHGAQRLRR